MPQHHRQSHSVSPHTSSRIDYPEQGFPSSYNGPSHTQMAYPEYESGGFLTAGAVDPTFPEPLPSTGGVMQRSTSGGHYRDSSIGSSSNIRRSPTTHTTTLYGPTSSSVRRSPSQPPSALRAPINSSVRRSPNTHTSTLYAPTNDSGHRSPSEHPTTLYAPAGYTSTVHSRPPRSQPQQAQQPTYYPSGGTQVAFDSTPQYVDGSQYTVPHGHGANASDGRYQSAAPVTRLGTTIAPDPPYRDVYPQERVPGSQNRDGYEYDDLNENEHLPKAPGFLPAQGRRE